MAFNLPSEEAPITCRSAEPHDDNVQDPVSHYFNCIEICERKNFFNVENEIWKKAKESEGDDSGAEERVRKTMSRTAACIEAEYHRTDILRKAIEDESTRASERSENIRVLNKKKTNLVQVVKESLKEWRASADYKSGIKKIQEWPGRSKKRGQPVDNASEAATLPINGNRCTEKSEAAKPAETRQRISPERMAVRRQMSDYAGIKGSNHNSSGQQETSSRVSRKLETIEIPEYCVERDVNAHIIQYRIPGAPDNGEKYDKDGESTTLEDNGPSDTSRSRHSRSDVPSISESGRMDLVPVEEDKESDWRFKKAFPDQRIPMTYLLQDSAEHPEDSNILSKNRNTDRVRHIHIPSNNMQWIECAIARYFEEERPEYDRAGNPKKPTSSSTILGPEYWRGQQNGGRGSRHMRPLCERVSSKPPTDPEHNRNNIVLFMPYLHWETDRAREQMSRVIEDQAEAQRKKTQARIAEDKKNRKKKIETSGFPEPTLEPPKHGPIPGHDSSKPGPVGSVVDAVARMFTPKKQNDDVISCEDGRVIVQHSPLGQLLLDAAHLYEAISLFRDKKISEHYMAGEIATLHPRRTLDQYYFGSLKTTRARDRDQVVYRGTTRDTERAHRFKNPEKRKALLSHMVRDAFHPCRHPKTRQWTGHTSFEDKHGCSHCTKDVQKVSRVIMVDQLWMWVLDEKTIITAFPKRYGFNKQDASGVHKCIRDRLKTMPDEDMKSVFNLALVILDECSYTFFDRTRTQDEQPQTMDIFSNAIGSVNNNSTLGFHHLWHWTEKAGKVYRSKMKHVEAADLHVPLLDIHPEGKLQAEIKDIIDELDMMIHVIKKQKETLKRFVKHVDHILGGPDTALRKAAESRRSCSSADGKEEAKSVHGSGETCTEDNSTRAKQRESFDNQASELTVEMEDRLEELEDLKRSAESTAQSVKDLLDLKQQQAGVVQAWQAVNQAEETISQGRAIMMFTIVTIVFLPLSFISSVFGMNNSDFGSNWSFREQAVHYMIPISAGIIYVTLLLAFSDFCRACLWWLWTYASTLVVVHTPLYSMWLTLRNHWSSQALMKSAAENARKLKEEVRREKARRKIIRRNDDEEKKKNQKEEMEKKKEEEEKKETEQTGNGTAGPGSILKRTASDLKAFIKSSTPFKYFPGLERRHKKDQQVV